MTILRCPHCLGGKLKLPQLVAPQGYCFDAELLLVKCTDCERHPPLAACTLTGEPARRWQAHRDLYGMEPPF